MRSASLDIIRLAGFIGSLVVYFPIALTWLTYIGERYYQHLLRSVGLDASLLDLPEGAFFHKGIDLVLDATSLWVAFGVLLLPIVLLFGIALGITVSATERYRAKRSLAPVDETRFGKFFASFNRIYYPFIGLVAFVWAAWLALYGLPPIADAAAEATRTCTMVRVVQLNCPPLAD